MQKSITLLFDFDGTLANTMDMTIEIFNALSEKFGFQRITGKNRELLRAKDARAVIKSLGISLVQLPFILKKVRVSLQEEISNIFPIRGWSEVLPILHSKGYQLGILTSNSKENVVSFLQKNELDIFDFIYSESSIFRKNSILRRILKTRRLHPSLAFYIGDETRDISAAKKVGLQTIAVTWGYNTEEALRRSKPDHIAYHPKDVLRCIETWERECGSLSAKEQVLCLS